MMRALLSVYDKTGLVEFAPRPARRPRRASWCRRAATARALADAGPAGDDRRGGHRRRPRCSSTGSSRCTRRSTAASSPTSARSRTAPTSSATASSRSSSSCSNLYPFLERPDIEMIDVGGPTMVRAAAKNHAQVGDRHEPVAVRRACSPSCAPTTARSPTRPAARSRSRRSRTRRRTTPRSCGWLQQAGERAAAAPRGRARPHRRDSCATARTRTSRRPATASRGTTSWWDGVHQHSGLALSYLNLYDADAAWRLVHDLVIGEPTARRAPSSSTPTRAASPSPTTSPTAYRLALECDERSAFGGIVALNRPIDAATVERMVAGPQADVVIAPAYDDGHARRADRRSARTRACSTRPPPEPPTLDYRQISGGFLVQEPHHFAADRDDWRVVTKRAPTDERVARRRARVAGLRAREVERDRAGEGRPGRRHRRRPAEPGRVGRDRGEEGGRARRAAARARATRSTRSPTASRPRPTPGSRSSCSPAARCATSRTSTAPTSSASRWCSPANGTSCIEPR